MNSRLVYGVALYLVGSALAILMMAVPPSFAADDGDRRLPAYGDFKPGNDNVRRDYIFPVGDFGTDGGALDHSPSITNLPSSNRSSEDPFVEKNYKLPPVADPDPYSMKSAWNSWQRTFEDAACIQFANLSKLHTKTKKGLKCEIVYTVSNDGSVTDIFVLQTSGDQLFDNKVRAALVLMSYKPFVQFPTGSKRFYVKKSTIFVGIDPSSGNLVAQSGKVDEPFCFGYQPVIEIPSPKNSSSNDSQALPGVIGPSENKNGGEINEK